MSLRFVFKVYTLNINAYKIIYIHIYIKIEIYIYMQILNDTHTNNEIKIP